MRTFFLKIRQQRLLKSSFTNFGIFLRYLPMISETPRNCDRLCSGVGQEGTTIKFAQTFFSLMSGKQAGGQSIWRQFPLNLFCSPTFIHSFYSGNTQK